MLLISMPVSLLYSTIGDCSDLKKTKSYFIILPESGSFRYNAQKIKKKILTNQEILVLIIIKG